MQNFLIFGSLELLMVALVVAVSGTVASFSLRYMDGDRNRSAFFRNLALLTFSVLVLVVANHVLLFVAAWFLMGHFLAKLIGHVRNWPAAKASAKIANLHFWASSAALIVAMYVLVDATDAWFIKEILAAGAGLSETELWLAGGFLSLAALIQSAIFPFHRWLLTSMNAPTPVSAFMHAGIVNAGGFLIVRFFQVYLALPNLLTVVFVIGALSALIGSMWMMVQSDVKRSLGSSTVAQMGFMMVQCGLGLFTAAIVHLILHGFFKAFHFLAAGSSIENPKLPQLSYQKLTFNGFVLMLIGGLAGGFLFAVLTGKSIATLNGDSFLVAFAAFTCAQAMYGIAQMQHWALLQRGLVGLILVGAAVAIYAFLFNSVNAWLPINLAQPLTAIHFAVLAVFFLGWCAFLAGRFQMSDRLYLRVLNTAQAPISTTMHDRRTYAG